MVGSQSIITLLSNFETITGGQIVRESTAGESLTSSSFKPTRPRLFLTGAADAVTQDDRKALEVALRAGVTDSQLQERMSRVNEAASKRTPTVSAGCHVASLHAGGAGSSRPFLTSQQKGDFLPPEFAATLKRIGLQLNPAKGPDGHRQPIRVLQSASGRYDPSERYFREQFRLSPNSSELFNNLGAYRLSQGKFDEAIDAFQRAAELDPTNAMALANLAKQVWLHKGLKQEADELYSAALAAAEPTAPALLNLSRDEHDLSHALVKLPKHRPDLHPIYIEKVTQYHGKTPPKRRQAGDVA
jgi:tetratricopeptide (TPR) repeat protein